MRPITDEYISVKSGTQFTFMNPQPEQIHIGDIAHSLGMQCRYNGHCSEFYSVAEHCFHIADWIYAKTQNKRLALEGLLHDASEAYLCDIPRPIKPYLDPHYGNLENLIERAIARRFNLTLPWNAYVKEADSRIVLDEYKVLFEAELGPCTWTLPYDEPLKHVIQCWDPKTSKEKFLQLYYHLTGA